MEAADQRSSVRGLVRRVSPRKFALAGMVGAAVFPVLLLTLDVVQYDFLVKIDPRFSPLTSNPISVHELGPYGWAMHLNFVLTGALLAAFAVALRGALRPSSWSTSAVIVMFVMALGFALGAFTLDQGNPQSWHGLLHFAGAALWWLASLALPFLLALAFLHDPHWRWWSWFSVAVGAVTVAIVIMPTPKGEFTNWVGVGSKVHLLVAFAYLEVLAIRLWRLGDGRNRALPT